MRCRGLPWVLVRTDNKLGDIMKARVQVKTIGAHLLGIKVPDTSIAGSPFYILLAENQIRKGWQVALVDAMAYYATSRRALMAQESDYDLTLNKAIIYLESLILMTEGESHANA